MKGKIESIFRRKTFEKLYYVGVIDWGESKFLRSSSDFRILGTTDKMVSLFNNVEISDEEIGRYDIEIPLLEVGDDFFLHDIQKTIKIKSRLRSSDGSIIYYVEDALLETENTQKSKEIADIKIENWNHGEEKIDKLNQEFEDYKKKYKYRHRFFNMKQS